MEKHPYFEESVESLKEELDYIRIKYKKAVDDLENLMNFSCVTDEVSEYLHKNTKNLKERIEILEYFVKNF